MTLGIVRLDSPRAAGEGLRIGTVRRPPRAVPRREHASRDFYDVWFPSLSPSEPFPREAMESLEDAAGRKRFERRFRAEMKEAGPSRDLDLRAALSHGTDVSIGAERGAERA